MIKLTQEDINSYFEDLSGKEDLSKLIQLSFKRIEKKLTPDGIRNNLSQNTPIISKFLKTKKNTAFVMFDTESTAVKSDKQTNKIIEIAASAVDSSFNKIKVKKPQFMTKGSVVNGNFHIKIDKDEFLKDIEKYYNRAKSPFKSERQFDNLFNTVKRSYRLEQTEKEFIELSRQNTNFKSERILSDIYMFLSLSVPIGKDYYKLTESQIKDLDSGELYTIARTKNQISIINNFFNYLDELTSRGFFVVLVAQNIKFDLSIIEDILFKSPDETPQINILKKKYEKYTKFKIDTLHLFRKVINKKGYILKAEKMYNTFKKIGYDIKILKDVSLLKKSNYKKNFNKDNRRLSMNDLTNAFKMDQKGMHTAIVDVYKTFKIMKIIASISKFIHECLKVSEGKESDILPAKLQKVIKEIDFKKEYKKS